MSTIVSKILKRKTSSLALLSLTALSSLAVLTGPVLTGAGVETANAQGKGKNAKASACGIRYLPFVEGRTWKYQYVIPPNATEIEKPLKTKIPETFTITVKSIEASKGGATITLEEKYRDTAFKTVLTCTGDKLVVPLTSFFYLGELPGGLSMDVSDVAIDGPMYPGKGGLKKGVSYFAKIKAKIARPTTGKASAAHLPTTLEMERQLTVGKKEKVEVEHGLHNAYGVEFAISGRVSLDLTPDKKVFLPDGVAKIWFADGIGVVRAYNRMEQGWALAEMSDQ
ncbi:MAG: hypothetical protein JKY56_02575 [Kofleriaceae bacterium]|nr:hypothetical protein [Kofleriaceae bacterium]